MKTVNITEFEQGELTVREEALYNSLATYVSDLGIELTKEQHGDTETVASLARAIMQLAANAKGLADVLGIDTDV